MHDSVCVLYFFFLFKQKTAYEMRISDWSSDVCSSDLDGRVLVGRHRIVESTWRIIERSEGNGRLRRVACCLAVADRDLVGRRGLIAVMDEDHLASDHLGQSEGGGSDA